MPHRADSRCTTKLLITGYPVKEHSNQYTPANHSPLAATAMSLTSTNLVPMISCMR